MNPTDPNAGQAVPEAPVTETPVTETPAPEAPVTEMPQPESGEVNPGMGGDQGQNPTGGTPPVV